MSILDSLSSATGDRTQSSNERAALECLEKPALLAEIAVGLSGPDEKLAGDCAEVMTKVAERRPLLVTPYAAVLVRALESRNTRVRWEAMHAIAEIAQFVPTTVEALLPRLRQAIVEDRSVIVRDHAVKALGAYAGTGPVAAVSVLPLLEIALTAWEGKQAAHALAGLLMAGYRAPALADEIVAAARRFEADTRPSVRKAVGRILVQLAGEGRKPAR